MTAELIRGPVVEKAIKDEIIKEVHKIREQTGKRPGLSIILVGDNPVSRASALDKEKMAEELGFFSVVKSFPATINQEELIAVIHRFNSNNNIHAIRVQLPLPDYLDEHRVIEAVQPHKEVDGLHPANMGNLILGEEETHIPIAPLACLKMLTSINYDLKGKHAVVVGRSNIMGKPMSAILLQQDATVTTCHSRTANLPEVCYMADVLVVAIGRPQLVKKEWVKPGAVVIDVGINRVGDRVLGDVDFLKVSQVAGFITPPGEVGAMTDTMFMLNTLQSFKSIHHATFVQ
ncbi:bifunctional 5,10-methylenetetrahydrofolate dehydrogenase/5,10-methenyltetrahydrofolate cyclohydrolase [Candidatus Contubernalis alkaliaceticus]|uniref:bifunctional 5,10-methylenetetrahydrofolate dehydrogenase/5,10-methenyltetrahydrofolate cyclohydrolase n=1 Tax=Candidatus Contubernalis alkaliaceticus TaxID=338645 RepID=UPI001F4C097F|nr:bifunctional 5,10-methylenetetrahydrofolate dehydrogenase/5,10-methenyltetrahydrofolate cyclohydrolase [Candidatus Contubernalis alkalaceticus]UNC92545.1 bifunctional 5,10-methylenetetrahydrofolate dehydrogenase/5,10-methenyltetrahydrofolate cyclohydrolase [Candidatus Contubernalis alkalaceticus]